MVCGSVHLLVLLLIGYFSQHACMAAPNSVSITDDADAPTDDVVSQLPSEASESLIPECKVYWSLSGQY